MAELVRRIEYKQYLQDVRVHGNEFLLLLSSFLEDYQEGEWATDLMGVYCEDHEGICAKPKLQKKRVIIDQSLQFESSRALRISENLQEDGWICVVEEFKLYLGIETACSSNIAPAFRYE